MIAFGALTWCVAIAVVSIFNYVTIGSLISDSHPLGTLQSTAHSLVVFPRSLVRDVVSFWGGSILSMEGLIAFVLLLLAGISALSTLRPRAVNKWQLLLGVGVIFLSLCMELVRDFSAEARLLGYGTIALLVGLVPTPKSQARWVAYALVAVVVACLEVFSVNRYGLNDRRYASLAADIVGAGLPPGYLYTNVQGLLDVQQRVPTLAAEGPDSITEAHSSDLFLLVDVPWQDVSSHNVGGIGQSQQGWCRLWTVPGAELFGRC
jgi:hypothetical protein